jgi:hypothetical protein
MASFSKGIAGRPAGILSNEIPCTKQGREDREQKKPHLLSTRE